MTWFWKVKLKIHNLQAITKNTKCFLFNKKTKKGGQYLLSDNEKFCKKYNKNIIIIIIKIKKC